MTPGFRKWPLAAFLLVMLCGIAWAQQGVMPSQPQSGMQVQMAPVPNSAGESVHPLVPAGGGGKIVQEAPFSALPMKPWLIDPETMPSLFFSTWTQALIAEARFSFQTRPPTESEIQAAQNAAEQDEPKDPGVREVALGGIVFSDAKDWTIWLNGQRVLPNALPPEVLDLRVYRYFVELKWFDAYTNQVFPIRLRPHQRFNLDARIFLPG